MNPLLELINPSVDCSKPSLFRIEDFSVVIMIAMFYIIQQYLFNYFTKSIQPKDMPKEIQKIWGEQFPVMFNAVLLSILAGKIHSQIPFR